MLDHATARDLYAIVDWDEIADAAPADQETRQFWARVARVRGWTTLCADTIWESVMFDPAWNLPVGQGEMGGFSRDWLAENKDADLPVNL